MDVFFVTFFFLLFAPGLGLASSQHFDMKGECWYSKSLLQVLFHPWLRCRFAQYDLLRITLPCFACAEFVLPHSLPAKASPWLRALWGMLRKVNFSQGQPRSPGSLQNQRWEMIPINHPLLEECLFSYSDYSLCQLKPAFVNHIGTYNQEALHGTETKPGKVDAYFKYYNTHL